MATAITMGPDGLQVPDDPIIPFIEGDGIGPDIWAAAVRVFDGAVEKAYGGSRAVAWQQVLAGEAGPVGRMWSALVGAGSQIGVFFASRI